MQDVLTGLGLVLVIEGLVYALAPQLVERLLEALQAMPAETRRLMGLTALASGMAVVWIARTL